jgi:hypothetical protein
MYALGDASAAVWAVGSCLAIGSQDMAFVWEFHPWEQNGTGVRVCSVAWVSGRADWNGCAVWLEPGIVMDGGGVQCGLSLAS